MRDIGKPRIVIVDWVDTVDSSGWDTKDDIDIKLVKQIGWLVDKNEKCIKIADSLSEEEYYGITAIPYRLCESNSRSVDRDTRKLLTSYFRRE